MSYTIKVQQIEHINHNVIRMVTDKPANYSFKPGQATNLAINKEGLASKKRPFTFTSLPEDETLEFIIKIYPSHNGVTAQIEKLVVGDELIIEAAWGAITYKGEGAFIAGGAGITPFIAILRDLSRKGALEGHKLFFSVNKKKDILLEHNLEVWMADNLHLTLSDEDCDAYDYGYIDTSFLKSKDLNPTNPVYLCGPPDMMDAVKASLYELGVSKSLIVTEA